MSSSTPLHAIVGTVAAALVEVAPGHVERLDDAALLAHLAAVERLGRVVDAARIHLAGEVAARSRRELGDDGISRAQNFTTPAALVSAITGASVRECRARLALGYSLRGAPLLGGTVGPPPFPAVATALDAGDLATEAAAVIVRQCAALAEHGIAAAVLGDAEQTLVDETIRSGLTADQTMRLAIRLREHLDPDGSEPREDRHQQLRSLTFTRSADGMLRGRFALTPEQSGVWISSIHALQSPRRATPRFISDGEVSADAAAADTRTTAQKNADTVTELIARAAGASDMPQLGGATTTVMVHVALSDLEAGRGAGWIDGIDEPVPVRTLEQLRCHSPIVATVFGDAGEVLYLGKTRRLFTPAQNRALAARDGGCVWPGCDRPPGWCESHHVEEWRHPDHPLGRTDIDNGLLLCHFHHSHLHRSEWTLTMQDGVPCVVPPSWIDRDRTPIRTTRRRAGVMPPGTRAA